MSENFLDIQENYFIECSRLNRDSDNSTNNIWKCNLDKNITINPGDIISVESSMIQSQTADNSIELIGDNLNNYEDNKLRVETGFYVNNNMNFIMPLPKVNFQYFDAPIIITGVTTIDPNHIWNCDYGAPIMDVQEGTDMILPTPDDVSNIVMMAKNIAPSHERFYIGQDYFNGLYSNGQTRTLQDLKGQNVIFNDEYDLKTSFIDLKLDKGIYNPQNLVEKLNDQIHTINKNPEDNFNEDFLGIYSYSDLVNGQEVLTRHFRNNYQMNDQAFKSIGTSISTIARTSLRFGATLTKSLASPPTASPVVNYLNHIRLNTNLCTTQPFRLKAATILYKNIINELNNINAIKSGDLTPTTDINNLIETRTFYSGISINTYNGNFGDQIVIQDFLRANSLTDTTSTEAVNLYQYFDTMPDRVQNNHLPDKQSTILRKNMSMLDLNDGDVVFTNLIANETNYQRILKVFELTKRVDDDGSTEISNLDIARANDGYCISVRNTSLLIEPFGTNPVHNQIRNMVLLPPPISLDNFQTDIHRTYINLPYHYKVPYLTNTVGAYVTKIYPRSNLVIKREEVNKINNEDDISFNNMYRFGENFDEEIYADVDQDDDNWGYRLNFHTKWKDDMASKQDTFHLANNNSYQTTLPNPSNPKKTSIFSFTDSNGKRFDHSRIKELGLGLVVGFRSKIDHSSTATPREDDDRINEIPFIGFVYKSQRCKRIPCPSFGEMLGISRSFNDIKQAKLFSAEKELNNIHLDPTHEAYDDRDTLVSTMNVGAENLNFSFDATKNKIVLNNLHSVLRQGQDLVGAYNFNQAGTQATSAVNSADEVQKIYNNQNIFTDGGPTTNNQILSKLNPCPFISSQTGVGFLKIYNFNKKNSSYDLITPENKNVLFKNSLLEKLGFSYEQIIGKYTNEQLVFNSGGYNSSLLNDTTDLFKYQNQTYPLTTNGLISTSIMPSLVSNSRGLPLFLTPGIIKPDQPVSVAAESDYIEGINTFKRYNYSHLVINTDLIDNKFYIGGPKNSDLSAIGYITKSYTSGSFIYSQQQTLTYMCDKQYNVSSITTSINTPDGNAADIDESSSIIYKIIKNKKIMNLDASQFDNM